MAKTKISEYDSTAANNTDVESVNIAEGCAPSGINNAIRQIMSHLKDFQTGTSDDSLTVGGNLTVDGLTTLTGALTASGGNVRSAPSRPPIQDSFKSETLSSKICWAVTPSRSKGWVVKLSPRFEAAGTPSLDCLLTQATYGRLGRIGVVQSRTEFLDVAGLLFLEQAKKSKYHR